ncbi:MAG: SRPBCC domain-containing protein [Actinomycetota bacterium]|nr:SRPBCC domain-containing protein [Actinomycetota bacterium]
MELQHHFTVPASLDEAWAAFNDLSRIGGCLPGATIESVDGDDFTGSVKVKLGPISLVYNGSGSYTTRDEATRRVVIEAKGKDKRGNGTASATISAQLSGSSGSGDSAAAGTTVNVMTDLAITGKPAQFGRGVIQDVSDKLLGQFVECIKGKLGAESAPVAAAAPTAAPAATTPAAAGNLAPTAAATSPDAARAASPGPFPRDGRPTPPPATDALSPSERPTPKPPNLEAVTAKAEPVSGPAPAELDLFSTVGPVLLQRYAKPALAALGGVGLLLLLRKLFSRSNS